MYKFSLAAGSRSSLLYVADGWNGFVYHYSHLCNNCFTWNLLIFPCIQLLPSGHFLVLFYFIYYIGLDKSGYQVSIFLISP